MAVIADDLTANVIGGVLHQGSGGTLPLVDPATGSSLGRYAGAAPAQVDAAFASAASALRSWRRSTPAVRQAALLALADAVEANVEQLLDAEVAVTGKPRAVTRDVEILRGADQLRFFAGAARTLTGLGPTEFIEGYTSSVRREPVGVIAQVTPWNYPFMMAIWKIAPAIAAGNTLVLKPAETTPTSTVLLARLAQEVLPPGVLNVILGDREVGRAMSSHPLTDMVAITGSVRAGQQVMASAATGLSRVHLELGGKAPAVIFPDADLKAAIPGVASAGFFNAGQDCTAATRVLVHQDIADEVVAGLAELASSLHAGGPDDEGAFCGPLNSEDQWNRVRGVLDRLPGHVKVAAGGTMRGPGFYLDPTVLLGACQDDEVVQSELFAPILSVQTFSDEREAVELANGVDMALASSLWTTDHARVNRLTGELDFGVVWVNCHQVIPAEAPHGGFKTSGFGKDLSIFGLEDYTRLKHVMSSHA